MATLIIPTTPDPIQNFTIDLDGETVDLTISWNITAQQWFMTLSGLTFSTVVRRIALVTGINLFEIYAIRELGQLWCIDLEDLGAEPNFDDFGDRFQLMYVEK